MIAATRRLNVTTKHGEEAEVQLRLYVPTPTGDDWECRYEMDWPADGWAARTVKGAALGTDAMHALQLGMQKLGVVLHSTSYHRAGSMRWTDGWVGYGFAVPKDARDLLKGDDAKFFG